MPIGIYPHSFTGCVGLWAAVLQVDPAKVIILEGILVLHIPELREQCSMRIFVDTGMCTQPELQVNLQPNTQPCAAVWVGACTCIAYVFYARLAHGCETAARATWLAVGIGVSTASLLPHQAH